MKNLGKGFSPFAKMDKNGEYFCAKCGKAGFTERKKINGHIGGCNGTRDIVEELGGTATTKGTTTTTTTTTAPPRFGPEITSAAAMMLSDLEVGHCFNQISSPVLDSSIGERLSRIERLTSNHISHLSGGMGGFNDFFSNSKVQVAILIFGVIAIFYILEKGDSKAKASMGGKILDFAMKKL